ncbi:hypothetical protein D5086_019155 [Populus alba]
MKIEEQQDEATEKEISHDESNTTSSFSIRPRGHLDLVNSSKLTKNKFVGSEFDTRLDAHFKDPNDHHVCLDIDSLNSIKIVEPMLQVEFLKISTFSVEVNGGLTPCGGGSGGARILPDARRNA